MCEGQTPLQSAAFDCLFSACAKITVQNKAPEKMSTLGGAVSQSTGAAPRSAPYVIPRHLSHGGEVSNGHPQVTSNTAPVSASRKASREEEKLQASQAGGAAAKNGREFRHFVAGGCGGMMGAMTTCPLEVVKTHLQSKNVVRRSISDVVMQIWRNDGVLGFWRGIGPMLAGVVPARAVNFWAYNAVKGHLLSAGYSEGPLVHMAGKLFLSARFWGCFHWWGVSQVQRAGSTSLCSYHSCI